MSVKWGRLGWLKAIRKRMMIDSGVEIGAQDNKGKTAPAGARVSRSDIVQDECPVDLMTEESWLYLYISFEIASVRRSSELRQQVTWNGK